MSSFIPGNGNDSTYFILHSEIGGSIKIQKFENNDQEYTTENMGELACPTDTGDEQSCTSIDVHFVTRLDSSLFFLSHDHVSLPKLHPLLKSTRTFILGFIQMGRVNRRS